MLEMHETRNEYFARSKKIMDIQVKDARGSFIFDESGERYIDFTCGWCVGNLGWRFEEVEKAVKSFNGPSYVSPHMKYRPWVELAMLLEEITPGILKKSFRATGGTEAVEIALFAAMEHTGRKKFIGLEGAYHGNSIGARALVGSVDLLDWEQLPTPLDDKALEKLEKMLKKKDVAGFIMEPVSLDLDVLIPEQKFMEEMRALCQKYGTLLIFDEVACGFGRTGKMFACEHFSVYPDIMCMAKSITGGAAGLGATIMTEDVANSLENGKFPYSTFGWHPLSTQAALANIGYMKREWRNLKASIDSLSEYFRQRLENMKWKEKPEIVVMGLAIGLHFEDEDYAREIVDKAQENGLILTDTINIFPRLNMEFEVAKEGLDIMEKCV